MQRGLATLEEGDATGPAGDGGSSGGDSGGDAAAPWCGVLTVRLHFQPAGCGHADDQFYLADKQNWWVGGWVRWRDRCGAAMYCKVPCAGGARLCSVS